MQKNNTFSLSSLFLLIILFSGIFLPFAASAIELPAIRPVDVIQRNYPAQGIVVNHVCPNRDSTETLDDGLIIRLIPCIRDTMLYATSQIMKTVYEEAGKITKALFALAIMAFGISVVTGNTPSFSQSGLVLALKIGAILVFSVNFGNFYPPLLNSLESLLNIMAKPATIAFAEGGTWNHIGSTATPIFTCKTGTFQGSEVAIMDIWSLVDCYIDLIIGGIFSDTTLKMGMLGFLLGVLVSGSVGLFVGFVGIYMLATALMTIFRAVYIFLTSYIAFSFMVLISIIFIPTILFQSTKRFFDGWLRLTMSFLLQPVFVFGYLIMFLVAINSTIFNGRYSLYYAVTGEDSLSRSNGDPGVENGNFYIGDWLNDIGALKEDLALKDNVRVDPNENTNPIVEGKETQTQGMLFSRSPTAQPMEETLGDVINQLSKINFFDIGIPIRTVDWELIAQRKNLERWYEILDMPPGPDKDAAIAKFYFDFKMAVLLAFLMAAIVIYIFYSLIEYLPFIGTATLGDGGILPFGHGALSAPGSKLLGGSSQ